MEIFRLKSMKKENKKCGVFGITDILLLQREGVKNIETFVLQFMHASDDFSGLAAFKMCVKKKRGQIFLADVFTLK